MRSAPSSIMPLGTAARISVGFEHEMLDLSKSRPATGCLNSPRRRAARNAAGLRPDIRRCGRRADRGSG